ncbi:hypothetical protein DRH14_00345 [Candidatus Shapirobacteria bacterium]|nr:MAG: hypothetical protein DRH14_00345 [Candidatus Shapirobacteria bacterium]
MNLRTVDQIDSGINVVLRLDTDLPIEEGQILDNSRLKKSLVTIRLLLDRNCKIIIIGHRGRPKGIEPSLSLKPVYAELMSLLRNGNEDFDVSSVFVEDVKNGERIKETLANNQIVFCENLRFWPEEKDNNPDFLSTLTFVCQAFINDSTATAHRRQASTMLYQKMDTYYGLDFVAEMAQMDKLKHRSASPRLLILGGAKKDKLSRLYELSQWADKILIAGKLPMFMKNSDLNLFDKVTVAELRPDGLDISQASIDLFKSEIEKAGTIVWAGAMGKFEDESSRYGSQTIGESIIASPAYKVVGGGDTQACLKMLGLLDQIDFVCAGGGVLLEWLANYHLPTIAISN